MNKESPDFTQHGFTLLEVLIVITLVGIMVSITALSFGAIDQRRLMAEADRLKLAFSQAADSALMRQETIGWFYHEEQNHYQFKTLSEENRWEVARDKLFQPHTPAASIVIQIEEPKSQETRQQDPRHTHNDKENSSPEKSPALVFFSSGEYTPFKLSFENSDQQTVGLQGNGFGSIRYQEASP